MNILGALKEKAAPQKTAAPKEKTRSDYAADFVEAKRYYTEMIPDWDSRAEEAQARLDAAKKATSEAMADVGRIQAERSNAHRLIDVAEMKLRSTASPRIREFGAELIAELQKHRERQPGSGSTISTEKDLDEWEQGRLAIEAARRDVEALPLEDLTDEELTARLDGVGATVVAAVGLS